MFTSNPSTHSMRQLRTQGRPLTVTTHSKHVPIPQTGPRGAPFTELWNRVEPAERSAAATEVPGTTWIECPSMRIRTESGRIRSLQDGVYLATGHDGLGVTMALGTGRLLADQVVGRTPEISVEPYLPARVVEGTNAA